MTLLSDGIYGTSSVVGLLRLEDIQIPVQEAGIILFTRNTAGTVKVWPRQDWDTLYSAPIAFTGTRNFRPILTAMDC